MSAGFGQKNPEWDLYKSKWPETDEYPLMKTLPPVFMIAAMYLLFVLKIGPAYMRKREAFKLHKTLVVYNILQVIYSMYMTYYFFKVLIIMGGISRQCQITQPDTRKEILYIIWVYFFAKITELLDTVFFVIRKNDRQVTFLHVYHHTVMVIGTWAFLKYSPSETMIFMGFFNSLVHVFMYFYYGLSAIGPFMAKYLTWKKYITTFQLVQFTTVTIQYLIYIQVSECPPPKAYAAFFVTNTVFFFFLFSNFYNKNYKKPKSALDSSNERTKAH